MMGDILSILYSRLNGRISWRRDWRRPRRITGNRGPIARFTRLRWISDYAW
jgi:hypothetical protein